AVFVLASLIVALLASSAAPTPLYAIYQAQWHFTPITTTVVFGVYALAVLASLLTLGKLSDHVGRRPVLLTALAVHAGSLVIFATATGVPALLGARVVQGLSTGAGLGAIGAAMLDMDRELGTFANAVAPGIGTATGAIAHALAGRFRPRSCPPCPCCSRCGRWPGCTARSARPWCTRWPDRETWCWAD